MIRLSAWLAIAVGVLLAVAQVARNFDNLANWPTWTIDIFAAVVLLIAALLALCKFTTRLLPVAWSFAGGLYTSSFVSHWNAMRVVSEEMFVTEQRLVVIVGGLVALSLAGIALVLFAPRNSD